MFFDILLVAILAFAMVFGFRSGFIYSCAHTIGWILSIVFAYVFSDDVALWVRENMKIYDSIFERVSAKFAESIGAGTASFEHMPDILSKAFNSATTLVSKVLSTSITEAIFTIVCFIACVIAVKLVLWLIIELLSRKKNKGFTGIFDGILGGAMGLVKGVLLCFLVLALLIPVSGFLSPEAEIKMWDSLANSSFALDLYNNNLLLLVVRSFIGA